MSTSRRRSARPDTSTSGEPDDRRGADGNDLGMHRLHEGGGRAARKYDGHVRIPASW